MQSQQTNLDVIANNLANVNTTGFKKSKAEFQDLLYQNTRTAGSETGAGNQLPTGVQIGHGSRLVARASGPTSHGASLVALPDNKSSRPVANGSSVPA